jgi:FAD/FMN-containing dehydrogenase
VRERRHARRGRRKRSRAWRRCCVGAGATRLEVSRDETQRLKFWSGRKNAFPASGGISPDYMCMDSTIPRKRLAEMLRSIEEMQVKYGCAASTCSTPATATCTR